MFHVGLDIHSKPISLCALNETGQLIHRSRVRSIDQMRHVLEGLPDRFEVCYEASCGYGHYHDLLRPVAARVLVAHPGQLRLIYRSKNKNDRNDAERLAKLLYLGEVPTVHVPSLDVRTWRELITCRSQVIAKRTRAKNSLRALLRGAGVTPPRNPGLWTKKGMAWLRQLDLPTPSQQLRRDLLMEEIESLTRQIRRIEHQLNHLAQRSPAVFRLRTIPGVGVRTAVSRRLKPASDRRVKIGHFEKGWVRRRGLLVSGVLLGRKEASDAESAQDGESAVDFIASCARTISA
jgi:transposase